ncbi:MAG: AAA family ATPase [Chitinophagaceae bacterium]|nr:AAA family ATPase [Chitinophagaceae bacterium]
MRITRLQLKNFKRFTDLTIENIPKEAKLVLLIGSNGSGKSSVFDAFNSIRKDWRDIDKSYYSKNDNLSEIYIRFDSNDYIELDFNVDGQKESNLTKKIKFIGRSSIRIVPRISNRGNADTVSENADSPLTFIDADTRFDNDLFMYIQEIDNALRAPVFQGKSADTLKIFNDFISPLNTSLINIFGGDATTTIQIAEFQNATRQSNGKLIFKKGNSKINYDLLSHGEKQVVILLLNFIVRKQYYEDAIIFIDEMDCHLNTSLQARLLDEIVNVWIPDSAQLWTASHALGFIDFARHANNAAIIDLNLLNFDIPQVILPQPKDSLEVYDIAVPKETIRNILKGHKLVAVENQNDQYYNAALGEKGYLFLPASNNREVFLTVKGDANMMGLRDRDYLKPEEIKAIKAKFPGLKILHYYAFENYIYHPDNIQELQWAGYNKADYIEDITQQKNKRLIPIVDEIATARQTYVEFKEGIKNDDKREQITDALQSNDFEAFYPYFNMKKHYPARPYLQQFTYQIKDLVQTKWFKQQIESILTN